MPPFWAAKSSYTIVLPTPLKAKGLSVRILKLPTPQCPKPLPRVSAYPWLCPPPLLFSRLSRPCPIRYPSKLTRSGPRGRVALFLLHRAYTDTFADIFAYLSRDLGCCGTDANGQRPATNVCPPPPPPVRPAMHEDLVTGHMPGSVVRQVSAIIAYFGNFELDVRGHT